MAPPSADRPSSPFRNSQPSSSSANRHQAVLLSSGNVDSREAMMLRKGGVSSSRSAPRLRSADEQTTDRRIWTWVSSSRPSIGSTSNGRSADYKRKLTWAAQPPSPYNSQDREVELQSDPESSFNRWHPKTRGDYAGDEQDVQQDFYAFSNQRSHLQMPWHGSKPLQGSLESDKGRRPARLTMAQVREKQAADTAIRTLQRWRGDVIDPDPSRGGTNDPIFRPTPDDTLALVLPLLILLSTLIFLLLLFIAVVVIVRRRSRILLSDTSGPLDVGREEEVEGFGGLDGVEERWLETVNESVRRGYARAKDWILSYPPGSQSTDITLSQFLTIQEKGVSAWSFDPDYESNPSVIVEARTEITFIADGAGMAPQEGGGCCVQSNLPLPKSNEVYYWECKMFTKPDSTNIALGLSTKPYPSFRLPGWSKFSIGYFSADGFKSHNYPFTAQSYGPAYVQGDVIGVGYRPRTGTVFFTRNGKKLDDAFVGLNRYNLFPTVGADGPAEVHVNLGQAGFVFIEANVKKWGLAPMVGTRAPPPAYGMERGSILIEAAQGTSAAERAQAQLEESFFPLPTIPVSEAVTVTAEPSTSAVGAAAAANASERRHRTRRASARRGSQPTRPSPLRRSIDATLTAESGSESDARSPSPRPRAISDASSDAAPQNPPTPGRMDISLHSLHHPSGSGFFSPTSGAGRRSPSPPPYDSASGSLRHGGSSTRRGVQSFANALVSLLSDRGLLAPLAAHDDEEGQVRLPDGPYDYVAPPSGDPPGDNPYGTGAAEEEARTRGNTRANAGENRGGWASWFAPSANRRTDSSA